MVINHNMKLVYDYINGEEIENIDILENNYKFMIDVISITRDKNMYRLCSESLKNNHEFVMFIINFFKDNKDFINEVALEYMNKIDSGDIRYKELCFVMSDIFNDQYDDRAIYYNLLRSAIYNSERVSINIVINEENDLLNKKQLGLGFILVLLSDLGKSKIITKYFAIKYLEEIFYEKDNMSFEDFIHSKFHDLNLLKKIGIKNFIIDYVKNYDVNLSDYLFVNIDLIKDVEKNINYVVSNWNKYMERTLNRKKNIFEQEVNNLISCYNAKFDYSDVCTYLDSLNLELPIKFSYFEGLEEICSIDINKIDLIDYKCLQKIIKLAKDLFLSNIIDKNYISNEIDNYDDKYKGRILKFRTNSN